MAQVGSESSGTDDPGLEVWHQYSRYKYASRMIRTQVISDVWYICSQTQPQRVHFETNLISDSAAGTVVWIGRSQATIDSLPNEMLTEIFTHATIGVQSDGPSFGLAFYGGSVDTQLLLRLILVCRRWHDVALAFAPLWIRIDCYDIDQLATFAKRAKSLPLSLYVNTTEDRERELDGAVLRSPVSCALAPLAHRLGRLDMDWNPCTTMEEYDYMKTPWWLFWLEMPFLKCLSLSFALTVDVDGPDGFTGKIRVFPDEITPVVLFNSVQSPLRALSISGITAWIPANNFPHLTHLRLSLHYFALVQMAPILSLLSRCPNLENLHLTDIEEASDEDADDVATEDRRIELPRLRSLLLSEVDSMALLALCTRLSLPSSPLAICAVRCMILAHSPLAIPRVVADDADTLDIRYAGGCVNTCLIALKGPASGYRLDGCYGIYSERAAAAWFDARLPELSDTVPLQRLTSLTMDIDGGSTEALLSFLSHMRSLESLTLSLIVYPPEEDHSCRLESALERLSALCDALGPTLTPTPMPDRPSTGICPALRRLRLACDMPPEADDEDMQMVVSTLAPMLEARAAEGLARLELLVVQPVMDTEAEMELEMDELADVFAPLGAMVETLTVLSPDDTLFELPGVREGWLGRGEDTYWEVIDMEKPTFPCSKFTCKHLSLVATDASRADSV